MTATAQPYIDSRDDACKWCQHLTLELPRAASGCIWLHACSVGEVNSVAPLIRRLLADGYPLHLTVVTHTGMQQARRLFPTSITVSYLPWDLPGLMGRLIDRLDPALLLLTETEFWPGMLGACRRRDIPVIGINTRISDRSFPRYRATRWLWQRWLAPVRLFLAQGDIDAARLAEIGIDAGRIRKAGNLKFVVTLPEVDSTALRQRIDPTGEKPLLVIASTHEGEESRLLPMWREWKRHRPELACLLVPRHPQRFDAVADLLDRQGIRFSRWSDDPATHEDVVLVDAMGVLQQLYTVADVVLIGGTLEPVGGHNPLEAAVCGRGVVTGPFTQNFRQIMDEMERAGAAIVAANDRDLEAAITRLLGHPSELRQLNARAALFMQDRANILDDIIAAIRPFLPARQPR